MVQQTQPHFDQAIHQPNKGKFSGKWLVAACAAAIVLAGCASKPTYQSGASASEKVLTNNRGVPNRYLVKQGDTVSKIAERYGLNWRELGRMNNLDGNYTIYTGQWLTLWQGSANNNVGRVQNTRTQSQPPRQSTNTRTQTNTQATRNPTPSQPAPVAPAPAAASTNTPIIGSAGVMQFSYPVAKNVPVVRRFGTVTINGQTVSSEGMWFSGTDNEAVLASRAGTVIHADGNNVQGSMVMIQHSDGFVTSYIHIKDASVRSGDSVRAGQQIAKMKRQSNGASLLEFRVAKNSAYVDPLMVLK
ncbi:Murein hydrolase activator NlpD precursor [Moraxella caviae]|nr:Murein hydrolase activator NlpD precursor [Moraxella caviae]